MNSTWSNQEENPCPSDGTQTLRKYVKQGLGKTDLSGDKHGSSDSRVYVASTDMSETLHHGSDAQPETERDEHQVSRWRFLLVWCPVDGWAKTDKHKD